MKFKIKVKEKNTNHAPWYESYNSEKDCDSQIDTIEEAEKWAEHIIQRFNFTLRKGEEERELLGIEVIIEPREEIMNLARLMEIELRKGKISFEEAKNKYKFQNKKWVRIPSRHNNKIIKKLGAVNKRYVCTKCGWDGTEEAAEFDKELLQNHNRLYICPNKECRCVLEENSEYFE